MNKTRTEMAQDVIDAFKDAVDGTTEDNNQTSEIPNIENMDLATVQRILKEKGLTIKEFSDGIEPRVAIINLTPAVTENPIKVIENKGNESLTSHELETGQHVVVNPRTYVEIKNCNPGMAFPLTIDGEEAKLSFSTGYNKANPDKVKVIKDVIKSDAERPVSVPEITFMGYSSIGKHPKTEFHYRISPDGSQLNLDGLKMTDDGHLKISSDIIQVTFRVCESTGHKTNFHFIREGHRRWAPAYFTKLDSMHATMTYWNGTYTTKGMKEGGDPVKDAKELLITDSPVNSWNVKKGVHGGPIGGFEGEEVNDYYMDFGPMTRKINLYSEELDIDLSVDVEAPVNQ